MRWRWMTGGGQTWGGPGDEGWVARADWAWTLPVSRLLLTLNWPARGRGSRSSLRGVCARGSALFVGLCDSGEVVPGEHGEFVWMCRKLFSSTAVDDRSTLSESWRGVCGVIVGGDGRYLPEPCAQGLNPRGRARGERGRDGATPRSSEDKKSCWRIRKMCGIFSTTWLQAKHHVV